MPTQETPLSAFFSSYTFHRYTYDPSRDPNDEFERLCVARLWGKQKRDENFAKYLSAVGETPPPTTPNTGGPAAPTQETRLSAFFSSFAFSHYTYDPGRDPSDEFERLCVARQWGKLKRDENFAKYLSAIGETSPPTTPDTRSPATPTQETRLSLFFLSYEFHRYTYDPSRDPNGEFERLCVAKQWGKQERDENFARYLSVIERTLPPNPDTGYPATPAQETPLSAFFSSHEFNHYTYDPSRDPSDEFERLCVARRWGKSKRDENFANYLSAIGETQPPTPNTGYPATPTQETRLSAFFSSYAFGHYAYDPSRDPSDEFERLCVARQWGKLKRDENFAKYLSAIGETLPPTPDTRGPATPTQEARLSLFFLSYEFHRYTYDPSRDPNDEFERLCVARLWGKQKRDENYARYLSVIEETPPPNPSTGHPATPAQETPLSAFFSSHEFNHYKYDPSRDPSDEFERLCVARRWGKSKRDEYFANYLSAIEETQPPTPSTGYPATPTQETRLSAFFSSFAFSHYTYDPSRDPSDEFERLCVARQWGKLKRDENFAKYLCAIGEASPPTTPDTGSPATPTQETRLSLFFLSYEFHRYTYDPSRDPNGEFERLCVAKQWGKQERDENFARYLSVIERTLPPNPDTGYPATPAQETPLSAFFSSHEFNHYKYDPSRDPSDEFERLCVARRWGKSKRDENFANYLSAIEETQPPTPNTGCPATPTQETPLSAFFSSYEFIHYEYDPSEDPAEEFERLCVARKWGKAKKAKNFERYLSAIEETRNRSLAVFFRENRHSRFAHDPLADPQAEFDRLQASRRWGGEELESVRGEFRVALGARNAAATRLVMRPIQERPPIAEFLKEREFAGYTYGGDRPELEFKRLVEAQRRSWEEKQKEKGRDLKSKEVRREWKALAERTALQEEFYEALEEQFNLRLDKIAGRTGLRRDEVMVELCGAGRAPLSKEEAKAVGLHSNSRKGLVFSTADKKQALASVQVNIYDFLQLDLPTTITAIDCETRNLLQSLLPRARALNFPDEVMLAVYSVFTHRVFPRSQAREGRTLVVLLRGIGKYFVGFREVLARFKREGGEELVVAVERGPGAVRELLLSRNWESLEEIRRGSG